MEKKLVRIAVAGVGAIGRRHAHYVASHSDCTLVGITDPGPAASLVSGELNVPAFGSVDELLDKARPDGVIIATPTQTHFETASKVVEWGIPALIEKPITGTLEEARTLVDLANSLRVPLLVGHHRRHTIATQRAKRILSQDIGTLLAVNVLWAVKKPEDYYDVQWRREKGAGPILINLIHEIDLLRHLCGEIVDVSAFASNRGRNNAVEDTAVAMIRFRSGAVGTITASDAAPSPWSWDAATGENPSIFQSRRNAFHFLGSNGSLEFPDLMLWRYVGQANPGWQAPISCETHITQQNEAYIAQLAHFCAVIRSETKPLIDGEDGLRTLAATLAIHAAADGGMPIRLWEQSGSS